jgi:hypothetical protein
LNQQFTLGLNNGPIADQIQRLVVDGAFRAFFICSMLVLNQSVESMLPGPSVDARIAAGETRFTICRFSIGWRSAGFLASTIICLLLIGRVEAGAFFSPAVEAVKTFLHGCIE